MYICVPHMYLVPKGQEKVSAALELEFWMAVNCHVDVRDGA